MSLKSYLKVSFQTSFASTFTILISIIRTKIVAILIGTTGIGLLGQINSLNNIIQFFVNLGMNNGIVKEISTKRTIADYISIEQIRSTFLLINLAFAIPITFICLIFSAQLSNWLYDSSNYAFYIKIFSLSIISITLANVYQTYLSADKLVKEIMTKTIVLSLLNALSIVLLINYYGIDGAFYAFPVNGAISVLFLIFYLRFKSFPIYIFSKDTFRKINISKLKPIVGLGGVFLFSSLFFQFVNLQLKNILIDNATVEILGNYQAAFNITKQYIPIFLSSFTVYLLPKFSEQKGINNIQNEVNIAIEALLIFSTIPFFLLIIFSQFIVTTLYSSDFTYTSELLKILLISEYIGIVIRVYLTLAYSQNFKKYIFFSDLAIGIGLIILGYLLIPKYGSQGIVMTYLIVSILHLFISLIFFSFFKKIVINSRNLSFFLMSIIVFSFFISPISSNHYISGILILILFGFYLLFVGKKRIIEILELIKILLRKF